jgi:hypothetical protein
MFLTKVNVWRPSNWRHKCLCGARGIGATHANLYQHWVENIQGAPDDKSLAVFASLYVWRPWNRRHIC